MVQERKNRIPLHRQVGVRVGLIVAGFVLVADLASSPAWIDYTEWLHARWFSPEALRAMADELERTGNTRWLSDEERLDWLYESLGFAALLAILATFLVSRLTTRRLTRLAETASQAPVDDSLPGPFKVQGMDEIAVLAVSMNTMRQRAVELLERLAQQDIERRNWVAQVSHDLRTPVTALSLGLDHTAEKIDGPQPVPQAELKQLIAAARVDVHRVSTIASDLLEVARMDTQPELSLEPVPAGELVHQTLKVLGPIAHARELELHAEVPAGLPELQADGRSLARALENLVLNALQHATRSVVVLAKLEANNVKFSVIDDGPGLGENQTEWRLDELNSNLSRADSAGLGLQVVARVVQLHGGSCGALNLEHEGAEVWIRIPLCQS